MKPELQASTIAIEPWYVLITRCAVRIRDQFGLPDKATEQMIVRLFRAALRPRLRAGRKPNQATVRAAALWTAGMTGYADTASTMRPCHPSVKRHQRRLWQCIYREVIPGFVRLDKLTKQYRTTALRRNVKAYLHRNKHK